MKTLNELKLKNLLRKEKGMFGAFMFKEEIQKLTDKLVLSETLCFYKSPRDYHEILGILNKFLDKNSFQWVDLTLCFSSHTIRPAIFPHPKIMIFLFGKRMFILKNIKEISGRIVAGDRWITKEVGISPDKRFSIKDFI